ncbi:MAG: hypothetical protein OSJ74_11710 [Clostridia bacterium]|nr:hypothetical protein [Clostridia bacterium]
MEDNMYFELPELIELTQFGGDFQSRKDKLMKEYENYKKQGAI